MTDFIQIVTTIGTRDGAADMAKRLLDKHIAGCVQVSGPAESHYRWEGKIETAEEWYCVVKTSAELYPDVEREIRALHPYEEPEILAFQVAAGSVTYLEWLAGTLKNG